MIWGHMISLLSNILDIRTYYLRPQAILGERTSWDRRGHGQEAGGNVNKCAPCPVMHGLGHALWGGGTIGMNMFIYFWR